MGRIRSTFREMVLPSVSSKQQNANKNNECGCAERKRRDNSIDRCLLKDSLWPSGKRAGPGVREAEFNPSFVNTKCCDLEQVT